MGKYYFKENKNEKYFIKIKRDGFKTTSFSVTIPSNIKDVYHVNSRLKCIDQRSKDDIPFCPVDLSQNTSTILIDQLQDKSVKDINSAIEVFLIREGIILKSGLQAFISNNILLVNGSYVLADYKDKISINNLQKIELYKISTFTDLTNEYAINLIIDQP